MFYKTLFKLALISSAFMTPALAQFSDGGASLDQSTTIATKRTVFGIFEVMEDKITVEMDGEINEDSLKNFTRLIARYPKIKMIEIIECGGSSDDEVNLKLSALVHQKGISTHVVDGGEIASGGVDFFLAGVTRTLGKNTKVGVHSWSDGDGNEATAYPKGHKEHELYITYYVAIGFTRKQAEDFYYYTITAATADDIHFMTAAELTKYSIVKQN